MDSVYYIGEGENEEEKEEEVEKEERGRVGKMGVDLGEFKGKA